MKAEISYYNLENKRRLYKLGDGNWVHRDISDEYDNNVIRSYYYYTSG